VLVGVVICCCMLCCSLAVCEGASGDLGDKC
jgi:hypothetical protein